MKKEDLNENFYTRNINPLDPSLVEDCLEIIGNIERRRVDIVNWDEKKKLNEVTKRSGHFLHKDEEQPVMTEAVMDKKEKPIDETVGASSQKEKDFMSGLGDVLRELEQLDGQKK